MEYKILQIKSLVADEQHSVHPEEVLLLLSLFGKVLFRRHIERCNGRDSFLVRYHADIV